MSNTNSYFSKKNEIPGDSKNIRKNSDNNKKYDLATELRNSNPNNLFTKNKNEDKYAKLQINNNNNNHIKNNNSKQTNTEKYNKKNKKFNNLSSIPTTMTPKGSGYNKISFHNIVKSMTASDFLKEKMHKSSADEQTGINVELLNTASKGNNKIVSLYKSLDSDTKRLTGNKKQILKTKNSDNLKTNQQTNNIFKNSLRDYSPPNKSNNYNGLTLLSHNTNSNKNLSNYDYKSRGQSKEKNKKSTASSIISKSLKMGQVENKKYINSNNYLRDSQDLNTVRNNEPYESKDYLSENHNFVESEYMSKCRARLANRLQKKSLDFNSGVQFFDKNINASQKDFYNSTQNSNPNANHNQTVSITENKKMLNNQMSDFNVSSSQQGTSLKTVIKEIIQENQHKELLK